MQLKKVKEDITSVTRMVDLATSTILLPRFFVIWLNRAIMTISTVIKVNSTHLSRNIRLNCANTLWNMAPAVLRNSANLLTELPS